MKDIGQILAQAAVDVLGPLAAIGSDPAAIGSLLSLAGWDLDGTGLDAAGLATAIGTLATDLGAVTSSLAAGPPDLAGLGALLPAVSTAAAALGSFASGWTPPAGLPADLPQTLIGDLLGQLLVRYLSTLPVLRSALELLGVLDYPAAPAVSSGSGATVRAAASRPRINLDLAGKLLSDPAAALMTRFGLDAADRPPAAQVAATVFPALADLAGQAGLQACYGNPGSTHATLDAAAQALLQRTLRIVFFSSAAGSPAISLDVAACLADAGTARVLSVVPAGGLAVAGAWPAFTASASLTGTIGPMTIQADGVEFTDPAADELCLTVTVTRPPGTGPMVRLGAADGPRFEIGGGSAQVVADLTAAGPGITISAALNGVRVVVPAGDSFLSAVLPPGLSAATDLSLRWNRRDGLTLNGSPGVVVLVPIGLSAGPVTLVCLRAAVARPASAGQAPAAVTASLGVDVSVVLGPVTLTITDVGIAAQLTEPAAPGQANLGTVDLGVGIKPPDGAGIVVDAGVVSGGGFLANDPASGRYAGAVELRAESLALKAFGLLDTGLPGGAAGYSLIVLITAQFPAVELGFGFTLNGIGGLAGVNRSVATAALRAGIKTDQLKNVLFPADPAGQASQIEAQLATVFPPAQGNYVIGPMVQLGWGAPVTLLTLELALLVELPPPVTLIVLGRITITLPDPDAPVVLIQMDSLGVIDFGAGQVSVDAVLFNSSIAGFALTGGMALRAGWLGQPSFALAIGGFNPAFSPPPGFPAVGRVQIALASGTSPRLRLAAYLALTSNTAQFGARLDLFVAGPLGITVAGSLSFDALFQFDPFQFVIAVGGSVTVASNGQPVLTASVSVTLTGPDGWHVQGSASFAICGVGVTVAFDTTIGTAQPQPAPPPVDLGALLLAALTLPANWTAALPADAGTLLTFGPAVTAGPAGGSGPAPAHPLAALTVHQRVLPLGVAIAKFGSATPADPGTFTITEVTAGGTAAGSLAPVDDWFAPAQFLQLSDADALARPSYEQLQAGVSVGAAPFSIDQSPPPAALADYQTLVYDTLGGPPREVVLPGPASLHARAAGPPGQNAPPRPAAAVPASGRGRSRFAGPALPLTVPGPAFTIVSTANLAPAGPGTGPAGASYTATAQALAGYLAANPGQAGQVQIVSRYEAR